MIAKAPQIGFDRFIRLDWVATALEVRAGKGSLEELIAHLRIAGLGKEALAKTRTKLNALVLEPRSDLVDFIDRGASLFAGASGGADVASYAWGAALAAYPYFGRVAEFTGRLTSIQGDCLVSEIHRRMNEEYGERQAVKRATQFVLQTQINWGALQRSAGKKRLVRWKAWRIDNPAQGAWLIESALRFQGRALPAATIQSTPVLYPFELAQPLACVVSSSGSIELRAESVNQHFVALKEAS